MGQHKSNPVAIAAKNGELPPKNKPMSKREREKLIYRAIEEKTGLLTLSNTLRRYSDNG